MNVVMEDFADIEIDNQASYLAAEKALLRLSTSDRLRLVGCELTRQSVAWRNSEERKGLFRDVSKRLLRLARWWVQ